VPSEKRERKRSKQERDQAYKAAALRKRRRRGKMGMAVAILAALGIGFVSILSFATDPEEEPQVASNAGPTTTTTGFDAPCPRADGTSPRRNSFRRPPPFCINPAHSYRARVETDVGTFVIDLDAEKAPETTNNFVFLARYHFYDQVPFHRVQRGFVIQGGNPPGEGITGPGYTFADENIPRPPDGYRVGQVLMAQERSNQNGSQFIIITGDRAVQQLPLFFSLFGNVSLGTDVISKIDADGGEPPEFTPKVTHTVIKVTIQES
jgi:cyclophilin family peptidyl-prolyl cis-trans isomerase